VAQRVCPPWMGYVLLNPFRKLAENPTKIFGPFVDEGMVVLEPGCAMGFFTLPLARMVGPAGKVVAVDMEPKMLATLERRARRAKLTERLEIRRCEADGLGIDDLTQQVDFCAVMHVVHEVPDPATFFSEIRRSLKPGAKLLVIEPKGHVSVEDFGHFVAVAGEVGLRHVESPHIRGDRDALFER
jgi:ubiquinone/menaquinone biosynthesis C-methylase UbiE